MQDWPGLRKRSSQRRCGGGGGGADEQAAVNPEDFTKKELRLWAVAGNHHPARVPVSSQSLG